LHEQNRSGYELTHGGCLPLLGVSTKDPKECKAFVDAAFKFVFDHPEVRDVLLIGRWTTGAEGTRFGANKTTGMFITDDHTVEPGYGENRRVLTDGLIRTVEPLSDRRVSIGAFIPEQPVNVPRTLGVSLLLRPRDPLYAGVDRATYESRQRFVRSLIARVAQTMHVNILDLGSSLCDNQVCHAQLDGRSLYVDDNHISATEAVSLRNVFLSAAR